MHLVQSIPVMEKHKIALFEPSLKRPSHLQGLSNGSEFFKPSDTTYAVNNSIGRVYFCFSIDATLVLFVNHSY